MVSSPGLEPRTHGLELVVDPKGGLSRWEGPAWQSFTTGAKQAFVALNPTAAAVGAFNDTHMVWSLLFPEAKYTRTCNQMEPGVWTSSNWRRKTASEI